MQADRLVRLLKQQDAYRSKEGLKPRMAGQALDNADPALESAASKIIADLRGERDDEVIQNAMDDLYSLRIRDKELAGQWDQVLEGSGLTRENLKAAPNLVDGDVQLVSSINERTPQAVELNWSNDTLRDRRGNQVSVPVQTRLHTQYEVNPVTGQYDVVPFKDPNGGAPLVTNYGVVGQSLQPHDVEFMDSDEYLGKRALQLAGLPVVANNQDVRTAVDLVNTGNNAKIDVEMLKQENLNRGDGVGFQVYTEMAPARMAGQRPRSRDESQAIARDMKREIEPMLRDRMSKGKMTLMQAIESLEREGALTNSSGERGPYGGKLLKDNGTYVDGLVHPVVRAKDADLNLGTKQGRNGQRRYVMPLESVKISDASRARDLLYGLKGKEALDSVSLRPMPGNKGDRPSVKAYLQVPQNSSLVSTLGDAVRQLYREQ